VHVALAARGFHGRWFDPRVLAQNGVWLAAALGVALIGRLVLSYVPPGDPGGHAPRALPETVAMSLAFGWLTVCVAAIPSSLFLGWVADRGSLAARWLPHALAACVFVGLALARLLTLPGAMVPRHAVAQESFGYVRPFLVLAVLVWLAHALLTEAFVGALAWLALGILLERSLGRARRAPTGRALFLLAFLALGFPVPHRGEFYGLTSALALAAAFGVGAASLVPWLRRADQRAGLLAGLFLAAPLLVARDPLAWTGLVIYVGAAHPRQRPFALRTAAACALLFAWSGWHWAGPTRGRALRADELLRLAFELDLWALTWPLTLLGLGLGAALFPWKTTAWTQGVIEAPRREARAIAALCVLLALGLATPWSPWFEAEALLILFPPLALLAGLLVIPSERPASPT
jgi:hypothetical protein